MGFGSVRHNFGLAVLSVALAFGVWMFITDTEQSTKTGWFPGEIPVQAVSVPEGLTLAAPLPEVRARIEAPEDVFENLAVEDFRATINLAGAAVGSSDVEVRVQVLSDAECEGYSGIAGSFVRRAEAGGEPTGAGGGRRRRLAAHRLRGSAAGPQLRSRCSSPVPKTW